ncbi:MAG: RdgB/HAM1 family non-canonical purine NTP pyrophosphatase [Chlamydiales bacterium]|nr:RdgB/HAM1 family non-canonical purine NTP pyrophosphatase [Chlamydiia bacterium]MCP5507379.1 RdgB/HAM1 family non-canonical purine NTP pyrophosphatase [Chlamydiales bacterium]
MEIVIASRNVHKIREFREMFGNLEGVDFTSLLDYPEYEAPAETGKTFKENALIKAKHAAAKLNKWVLADDSGLVVPTLNGAPGVISRRYAGDDATDAENRAKLLESMHGFEDLKRAAYYECCLVLAGPEIVKKEVTGICEGMITESEKGSNGFGYDSIFIKHDYDKTFGELEENTKNRVSHRRKAVDKMLPTIETLEQCAIS